MYLWHKDFIEITRILLHPKTREKVYKESKKKYNTVKHKVTTRPSDFTPRKNEKLCPHKILFTTSYSSIIIIAQSGNNPNDK